MSIQLTPQLKQLKDTCLSLLKRPYCIYSDYPVAAALEGIDGQIYCGVNVENASYPCGWCAEVSAFAAAVTAGVREFKGIAVAVDRDEIASPCGRCRQVIVEFCMGKHVPIILANRRGEYQMCTIEELHPMAFQAANLNK